MSSGNGFRPDGPQQKGLVGKEEALRMEEEALAKLRREKRTTLPSSSSFQAKSSRSTITTTNTTTTTLPPQAQVQAQDLIVFPEARVVEEPDHFRDIDVDKLSKEELEKLLLDENFGAHSKVSRPSSLLGFNLSASYPGGHVCSSSPFQSSQWSSVLATPSGSSVNTPTQQPTSMFSSGPFPKPGSFQNGFAPTISPYLALTPQPTSFMTFAPIQPTTSAAAMVFPSTTVDPQMAKLLDKVASTYEYQKNGKGGGVEPDPAQAVPPSLAPNPPPPQLIAAEAAVNRFDWLDLDPLTKPRPESQEVTAGSSGPSPAEPGEPAGDPWDAVLETEGGSSPLPEKKGSTSARSLQKRSSPGGTAVTRSHSLNVPGTSTQRRARSQVLSLGWKGPGLKRVGTCAKVKANLPNSI